MAVAVPYNPTPTVAPGGQPTPSEHIDTPIAAFGGTIAAATSHLGEAVSGAGNEIFARGMAMQDLYNHSQAIQADADFMKAAGDVHAKLSTMQGKDAVEYYQNGYKTDLDDARQSIRDGLPNEASQKLYDQSSLSTLGRTIFNGAGHAATENKQYAIGASSARVKIAQDAALQNPTDEDGFKQHVQDVVNNTKAQWELKGADSDTINNTTHKAVSDLYVNRITGLAKTQPFMANKILNDASAKGLIEGGDLGKITGIVQSATHTVGARNLSSEVRSGADLSPGSGIVSIGQAKLGITGAENGGQANYQALGPVVPGRGQALGRYQIMPENLSPWLKEAGLPSMTPAEFLKSPSAQDKVFETVFGRYMNETGSANEAASKWFTGKTIAEAGRVTDKTPTSAGHNVPWYLSQFNRAIASNAPLSEQVAKVRTKAGDLAPDDPLMADYAEQRVIADFHQTLQVRRDDSFNNRQTIEAALIGGDQKGNLPTSLEQLKNQSPQVEVAWDNLQPSEQRKYLSVMAKLDRSDVAMTPERLKEYQRLKGESQSNPAAFLDEDVVGANLPISVRKELINLQVAKKANAEVDPRVTHALQTLRPTMEAAGITHAGDTNGYDQFVGALQGALDDFAGTNKRGANAKETMEIGQRLLQSIPHTGYFRNDQVYNVTVPDAEKQKIVNDPFWKERNIVPTDDQVQRIYARQIYQKLYGGTTKATTPPPALPQSK